MKVDQSINQAQTNKGIIQQTKREDSPMDPNQVSAFNQ